MKHRIFPGRITTALWFAVALCACALFPAHAATFQAAADTSSQDRVSVTYVNPESFAEHRQFGMQDRFNHVDYLAQLKDYLIKRGTKILGPGQHLAVNITDISLAGAYEPGRGPNSDHIRMMRDVYPPRIDLDFQLTGADGQVLREGKRTLRGLNYLQAGMNAPGARNGEPLYYDKALLERWLRGGPDKL